jgi:hypothetical protein
MPREPHFLTARDWAAGAALLTFTPRQPRQSAGHALASLQVHVRDHKRRELAPASRTLEAHYGAFVLSQSKHSPQEARRLALTVRYGLEARTVRIGAQEGRAYDLGPVPEPDDPDGRMPAVLTWADGGMFFLLASGELGIPELHRIAESV